MPLIAAEGFPRSRRVRKRRDFAVIYASGTKLHSRHFLLFAHWKPLEPQKTGFAVSRKIGNAVARNRLKRMLREYFRKLPFCILGCQLAVVAKQGAAKLNSAAIGLELDPLARRLAMRD